jgi:hypothetical protein
VPADARASTKGPLMGPHRLGDGMLARWRKLGNGFDPPWGVRLDGAGVTKDQVELRQGDILGGEVEW